MRLAVDFGGPLVGLGIEKSMHMVKEAGFDGIDYNIRDYHLGDDFREIAKDFKALMDDVGLCCVQVHSPHNFEYGTAMDFSNHMYRENFRSLEFAKILGTDKCVIHCSTVPEGPLSGQFTEHNYKYYKTFEEEAKRVGVYIGIENIKITKLHRPEYMNMLLNMLDSSVYYPHVDMGHAALVGIAPDVFLKKLTCLPVRGMHVHDYNVQTDHVLPFLGCSDWDRIVKTIVDIGYDGDLVLEIFRTHQLVEKYSPELLPAMYRMVESVGREFIRRIEAERRARA